MNKRTVEGVLAGFKVTNEEWECPSCEVWSNSVSWFCIIPKEGYSVFCCPKCSFKLEEKK